MGIICPQCLTELFCRCPTCTKREEKIKLEDRHFWRSDPSEFSLQCPVCEFVGIDDFDGPDAKKLVRAYRKERGLR